MQKAFTRNLSSTSSRRGLGNFYQRLMGLGSKPAPEKLHDPTKSDKTQDSLPEDSKPRKLRVLGKPRSIADDWVYVRKAAEFTPWPTKIHQPGLSVESLRAAVDEHFPETAATDIDARFAAFKAISQKLGLGLPDSALSIIETKDQLLAYLISAARPYDEKQPDAVYLDQEDFTGLNVTLEVPAAKRLVSKRRYKQLLHQARIAERRVTAKAFAEAA